MANKIDITGQRYGKLVVTGEAPPTYAKDGSKVRRVYCNCDCGNKNVIIRFDSVRSGHTRSCGCLAKELTIERNKKLKGYNEYDLSGEYGKGYTSKGVEFIFDKEDYDKIYPYRWNVNSLNYITAHDEEHNRKTLFLHRVILDQSNADWRHVQIDHINGNVLDNRKCNLRISNASQNAINRSLLKNNTSGVAGVNYHKNARKWVARINPEPNKRIILGWYDDFKDAVKARKEAEKEYYGEYSYDASVKIAKNYNIKEG